LEVNRKNRESEEGVVSKKNETDLIEKLNEVKNQMPNIVRRKKD